MRDSFVRELDMSMCAGIVRAGAGIPFVVGEGAGYMTSMCVGFVCAGAGFHIHHGATG